MKKYKVGILGATGMVGQRFITLLSEHKYFEIVCLAASKESAGKRYGEICEEKWKLEKECPKFIRDMQVYDVQDINLISAKVDLVFSAVDMPTDDIKRLEEEYAKAEVVVVSNNSAHRWTEDVPMVMPEINANHLDIIEAQKLRLGTKEGFIVVKPNCSIQSYTPVLYALREYEPYEVVVTTYQAISGAGQTFDTWPEMIGNIIPFINGEEEKSEKEPLKILGTIKGNKIVNADNLKITSQCIRVPVLNGHTATVFVKFRKNAEVNELINNIKNCSGEPQKLGLPSAPKQYIHYFEDNDRPQVLLDVDSENGMSISVGRFRKDSIFDYKFVGLSHNTLRGAAGGAVLIAELLVAKGFVKRR